MVEQYRQNSMELRQETQYRRTGSGMPSQGFGSGVPPTAFGGLNGQMVESIMLESNATSRQNQGTGMGFRAQAPTQNSAGHLRYGGGGGGGSLDETLAISHHGNMESFDELQSSIDTKRLKTNSSAFGQEDQVEIQHFNMREFKEPVTKEVRDRQLFEEELKEVRDEMKFKNTSRMQEAMGPILGTMRKVHTREMSRLFRSKKEIYQILTVEGQFYLPPYEECTLDFVRQMFCGTKKVSAFNTLLTTYSTSTTAKSRSSTCLSCPS